ncbi:MAG: CxxH/CxxC protein [Firmicutes bacterium]|nr:CxxH/CxxC protein [Bacillota bacterium]
MYVVCKDHLNEAIDEFLVEYEQSPDVYKLEDISFTEWTSPSTCEFCDKASVYLVV